MRNCYQDAIFKFFPDSFLNPTHAIIIAQFILAVKTSSLLDIGSEVHGCSALVHHHKSTSSQQTGFKQDISGGQAFHKLLTHARAIAINWR